MNIEELKKILGNYHSKKVIERINEIEKENECYYIVGGEIILQEDELKRIIKETRQVSEEREQKIQNFKEVIKVLENNMLDDIYTNVEKNFFKEEIIKFLNELVKITM